MTRLPARRWLLLVPAGLIAAGVGLGLAVVHNTDRAALPAPAESVTPVAPSALPLLPVATYPTRRVVVVPPQGTAGRPDAPASPAPPRPTTAPTTARPAPATPRPSPPAEPGDVHPGAFCANPGAIGFTATGRTMVCSRTASDDRYRWRAVGEPPATTPAPATSPPPETPSPTPSPTGDPSPSPAAPGGDAVD